MTPIEPSRFAEGRAMLLAGVRRMHTFGGATESIPAQWEALSGLGPLPGQQGTTAYGAICFANPETQEFEYLSGYEVASFDALPREVGRMRVPVQHYAVFTHEGHVSTLRDTWGAIWDDWLPRSGRQPANTPDFEVYDARFDLQTGLGTIEIWIPIQPA